ncbi:MAG: class I SAM-dependent methyltransferase, partial [Micrococcales bacterium]|nr:class I SAM-dependent methyltransferase [Micrococcales bacterium]
PTPEGRRPAVIRALNVLRQYEEHEVPDAWERMRERLQPGGLLVEGTCSELGRVASWVGLSPAGPETLTLSLRVTDLASPSVVAERLPKALIHRNVPGEPIHDLLRELDERWSRAVPLAAYGPRQRFLATASALRERGWPVRDGPRRWRLGELTVDWSAVAPR